MSFGFPAWIIVSSGFPDADLIVRLSLVILIFSVYVPGFTVITSPEVELFTAFWIESPGWTEISAAAPILDIDTKIRRTANKLANLLILKPPFI